MDEAVSVDEAWNTLREVLKPSPPGRVEVRKSLGRVLAQDIFSPNNFPQQDVALRDGYAMRVADLAKGRRLRVKGGLSAGQVWQGKLDPGEALRVGTGAAIPGGADAVLPLEDVRTLEGGLIASSTTLSPGTNVGHCGSMARTGEKLLSSGRRIGAEELAILAGIGWRTVNVSRRPQVGILPTGSELIKQREMKPGDHVFTLHGLYLNALVQAGGGRVTIEGPVPDNSQPLREGILRNRGKQFLITIGGTGPGEKDLIFRTMEQLDAQVIFRGIRMRPGHTISLYSVETCPILALPGGLGGVQVGSAVLVRQALRHLQGEKPEGSDEIECVMEGELDRDPDAHRFVEACVWADSGLLRAAVLRRDLRSEGLLSRFGQGWIKISPGRGQIKQGSRVLVLWKDTALATRWMERRGEGDVG
jgi:molybdopterin molybdotransferase